MAQLLKWGSHALLAIHDLHPTTISCASILILLLTSAWRHYDTYESRNPFQQEIWIEWLSWAIIFVCQKLFSDSTSTKWSTNTTQLHHFWSSTKAVWTAGALAVSSQLLSGQRNLTWALPLTTIAVTIISHAFPQKKIARGNDDEKTSSISAWLECPSSMGELKEALGFPSSIILNLVCWALFFNYREINSTRTVVLEGALFLILRSAAIQCMSRLGRPMEDEPNETNEPDTGDVIGMLSQPVLAMLTIVLVLFRPDLQISSAGVIAHASIQAMFWVATIVLIRSDLTNTVANLDTIALSTEMALMSNTLPQIGPAVGALLVSATQSVIVLRPTANVRKVVYGSILVLTLGLWVRHDPRLATGMMPTRYGQFVNGHPIENLVVANRIRFDGMLSRQSQNLEQAVNEYQKRYGRRPPLGFDKWFQLARDNKFVLIDEFDTLMQTLEPFHGIHPAVLQQRLEKVLEKAADQMVTYNITDGKLAMSENLKEMGERLTDETWLDIIPYNMTLAINGFDEAMVSAPWEEVRKAMEDSKLADRYAHRQVQANVSPILQIGGQSAWSATSQACSVYSPARQIECPAVNAKLTEPLKFIHNVTSSKDVCQNCELLQQEGFLMGPDTLNLAHQLVPVWSASKPSHFHDILYPSAYYIDVRHEYDGKEDIPWEEKGNSFYWVGTATGGRVTEANWKLMQRQRLVLKTQKGSNAAIQLLEQAKNNSGIWQPRFSTMAEISDLFATRISGVVQCSDAACEAETEAFGIDESSRDGHAAAWAHKFVLDVDGNTFSGRFYRLLRSRSMVIKQTIFKEWHDDRLVPWVHYAPVSTSFEELPEMARFFATTERGEELAKRMAEESTVWHNRALRDVDIRLVWLRMLLEYGRLMNPGIEMTS